MKPYLKLLSQCVWVGFKATYDERKLIMQYAKRLRESKQEGVWVDPLEKKA